MQITPVTVVALVAAASSATAYSADSEFRLSARDEAYLDGYYAGLKTRDLNGAPSDNGRPIAAGFGMIAGGVAQHVEKPFVAAEKAITQPFKQVGQFFQNEASGFERGIDSARQSAGNAIAGNQGVQGNQPRDLYEEDLYQRDLFEDDEYNFQERGQIAEGAGMIAGGVAGAASNIASTVYNAPSKIAAGVGNALNNAVTAPFRAVQKVRTNLGAAIMGNAGQQQSLGARSFYDDEDVDVYARDEELEFDVYAREAEPEFEEFDFDAREAEPEAEAFEEELNFYSREAEAEPELEAVSEEFYW